MTNKQERGAIMVEVLAVLALIGVMGPMIYRQVLSRNQEISNVNIAAEMRAIKEAMSAAIAADGAILAQLCKTESTNLTSCAAGTATFQTAVSEFLPIGMEHILDSDYGYDIQLYSYNVTLSNGEDYPIVVGVVGGTDLASDWSLKRAARVANLIGTDGGIVQNGNLVGAGGSWQLDGLGDLWDTNAVVATTAIDTFDPDLGATDPNAVSVPGSLAFSDLHAWNYFSVGSEAGTTPCYTLSRTLTNDGAGSGDATAADAIYGAGGNGGCDPLFWVGAKGGDDKSRSGQVYVRNNLYVGRNNADNKQAFAFEVQNSQDHEGTNVDNSRIVVYNVDGDDTLTIDATGKIVSDKTVTVGATKNADGTITGGTEYNYGLDPANTSVLNDVRLAARGGARLSDILPTYISKGMYQLSSFDDEHPFQFPIPSWNCPEGYARAITVTPLKWGMPSVESVKIPEMTAVHSLTVNGTSVKGDINIPEQTVIPENIALNRQHFMIEIGHDKEEPAKGIYTISDRPMVSIGYKTDPTSTEWTKPSDYQAGEITVLVQKYCVYVSDDYDPTKLTDDYSEGTPQYIPDNLKK